MTVIYIITYLLVTPFFKRRFSQPVTVAYYVAGCLIHTVMSIVTSLGYFKGLFVFSMLMLLTAVMYTGEPLSKRIYCAGLMIIFYQIEDFVNLGFYFCISGFKEMVMDFSYPRQLAYVFASFTIDPLLIRPARWVLGKMLSQSQSEVYKNLLLIALCFIELVFVNYTASTAQFVSAYHYVLQVLLFALLDIALILLLNRLDKIDRIEEESKLIDQQLAMQQKYYQFLENQYHDTRILAHDMKNHLLSLKRLYQNGEVEKGELYTRRILDEIDQINADYAKRLAEKKGDGSDAYRDL